MIGAISVGAIIATSITTHPIASDDVGIHFDQHPKRIRGRTGVRYRTVGKSGASRIREEHHPRRRG
jgi:hypothetical protein